MTQFEEILKRLAENKIRFVLIGGVAASAQGSAYVTNDLDIVYDRSVDNVKKLVSFLKSIHATIRGKFPDDLPFILDEKTFSFGVNFTFHTDLGDLDTLGEMAGVGNYTETLKVSDPIDLYNMRVDVLSLKGLIQAKRAAGRPKDIAHLKELEAILEMKEK